jgi:hypothetical protein
MKRYGQPFQCGVGSREGKIGIGHIQQLGLIFG